MKTLAQPVVRSSSVRAQSARLRLLLGALLTCGTLACGGSEASSGSSDSPNLLFVTIDTVRTDRLGCYGYDGARTPVLDSLAADGVVFDEAYTPAPMTLPAHSTMMTGLLPPQHGARVNGMHKLADDVPTLAEKLSAKGYRTGAFVAAFVLDGRFGLDRGFDVYDDDLSTAYEQEVAEGLSTYRPGSVVVDTALSWLDGSDKERPFFAWVHLYDAHYPWHPHGDESEGSYDGEVAYVDQQIGRLVNYLRVHGLEQDTWIVAVADHGEGLGDHHEIEHAYLLNEEVLHVPLIVKGPGAQAGHRVPSLVTLQDLQPTICELFDMADSGAAGRSVAAALRGEEIESGESYAETDLPWTGYRWAPQRSLTTVEWKYIRTPQPELYDRALDRGEQANMAAAKEDVMAELEERLGALEAELGARESAVMSLTAEELEQLAALGYAGGASMELPSSTEGLVDIKERLPMKDLATKLRRGLAMEAIGPAEHLAIAKELVAGSPETPSFHNQVGQAYISLGDFGSALESLELVVEMVPTDAGAHYALGDALQQVGRTADARPHLEMALELEPKMATAHVGMGNVLRSEGRPDLAAGEYLEAIRLRPDYPEAHYNLALTFSDRGKPAEALKNFQIALEQKPGWDLAHRSIASLLLGAGRLEEAFPHFEAALTAFPGDADLLNDFGVLNYQLGRPNEARDLYVAAMKVAPAYYRPHVNLANLAFDYGNDENALREYEEAMRLAPNLAETSARLARFLATTSRDDLRNGERAVPLAERAVDLTGGTSAAALDTLAAAYACAGRFPDAVTAAHQAQKRADLDGDAALSNSIADRLALYALEKPFVVERVTTVAREASAEGELSED